MEEEEKRAAGRMQEERAEVAGEQVEATGGINRKRKWFGYVSVKEIKVDQRKAIEDKIEDYKNRGLKACRLGKEAWEAIKKELAGVGYTDVTVDEIRSINTGLVRKKNNRAYRRRRKVEMMEWRSIREEVGRVEEGDKVVEQRKIEEEMVGQGEKESQGSRQEQERRELEKKEKEVQEMREELRIAEKRIEELDTAAQRWEAEAARKEEKEMMLKLLSRERQEMEEELEEAKKSLTDKEVQIRRLLVEVEENSIIMVNLAKERRDKDKEWAEKEKEWGKKIQVVDNTREKQLQELVQRAEIVEREFNSDAIGSDTD